MDVSALHEAPMPGGDEETKTYDHPFQDPEVRARAAETRAANREAGEATPLTPGQMPTSELPKAKRGGGRPKKEQRSLESMEQMLISMHFMVAAATGFQEMCIDKAEAHTLAEAIANFGEYYGVKISGKTGAIIGLIYAAGIVYGPRAITIGIKLRNKPNGNPQAR